MNFAPKNIYRGSIGGKDFNVEEYDFETRAGLDLAKFLITVLMCGIIAPFVSPLICLFIILGFNGGFKIGYLICIVLSGYFLYDAYNGGLVMTLASFGLHEPMMNIMVAVNACVLGINLFLLFFGWLFVNDARRLYLIPLSIIGTICFVFTLITCEKYPDWIDRNIGIGKYKVEETF